MGIDLWNLHFLLEAHRRCGPFGDLVQIGRQEIHIGGDGYAHAETLLHHYGFEISFDEARQGGRYADEGLLQLLGATNVQAADASSYEGASIVHDFNDPIDLSWHQRFDTVFDGGSLEHIFNVPAALANQMNMAKVGGRLLSALPANNWLGHGFYQFSQELPFRTLTRANGFDLKAVFFSEMAENRQLFEVSDLARRAGGEIGTTPTSTLIFSIGDKLSHVVPFRRWPQQGDYNSEWDSFEAARPNERTRAGRLSPPSSSVIKKLARRIGLRH